MKHAAAPKRIAMWSGPRNISTAMMRAWENRSDTIVVDEPFYACYLAQSGHDHPGRDEVMAALSCDWRTVISQLASPLPDGITIQYQKQMTHHLDDSVSLDWLDSVQNCFLIRRPRNMLASLLRVLPDAGIDETGLPQQRRLFEHVRAATGVVPPVIDSADVLRDPAGTLATLCRALAVDFSEKMLHWPAGPRDSDGVWARFWYASVERSTGFAPYRQAEPEIPPAKNDVLAQCEEHYEVMAQYRLEAT